MAQKKHYTPEQMDRLSKYEKDLRTSAKFNYCMPVSSAELRTVSEIFTEATGIKKTENAGCGYCVLDIMRSAGKLYFEQKEAQEAEKSEAGTTKQPKKETAGNAPKNENPGDAEKKKTEKKQKPAKK